MSPTSRQNARYTIDELAEQAARALATGYDGPADARARAVPDLRTLRYYTTLGLLDRPVEMRGRTALYSRRHLLQIVAIKRLQAEGLALADIQGELAGITDTRLERVARLSASVPPPSVPSVAAAEALEAPARFWARSPAAADTGAWDVGRSALLPEAPREPAAPAFGNMPAPAAEPAPDDVVAAIRLAAGVTLVVDTAGAVSASDVDRLRAAAAPLLSLLAERGLVPSSAPSTRRPR